MTRREIYIHTVLTHTHTHTYTIEHHMIESHAKENFQRLLFFHVGGIFHVFQFFVCCLFSHPSLFVFSLFSVFPFFLCCLFVSVLRVCRNSKCVLFACFPDFFYTKIMFILSQMQNNNNNEPKKKKTVCKTCKNICVKL